MGKFFGKTGYEDKRPVQDYNFLFFLCDLYNYFTLNISLLIVTT